jgi:hypothetical protein
MAVGSPADLRGDLRGALIGRTARPGVKISNLLELGPLVELQQQAATLLNSLIANKFTPTALRVSEVGLRECMVSPLSKQGVEIGFQRNALMVAMSSGFGRAKCGLKRGHFSTFGPGQPRAAITAISGLVPTMFIIRAKLWLTSTRRSRTHSRPRRPQSNIAAN